MKWIKKGLICDPSTFDIPWYKKNAMVPVPRLQKSGLLRIYFTMCDENITGRAGYIDLNPENPSEIKGYSRTPILDIGAPGTFDDSGVLPASLLDVGDDLYMFYSGYQKIHHLAYVVFSGVAVSKDEGETFTRLSRAPLLDRIDSELSVRSNPVCLRDKDGFRMYYASGSEWTRNAVKDVPIYDLKCIQSDDFLNWRAPSTVSIALKDDEYGITVPSIWQEDGIYKVIYSIRSVSKEYRLGYGESKDGIQFTRMDDKVGIDVSESGWDSEMICFSNRFTYKDKTYLFYVGNHYGQGGLGYAELAK